MSEVELREALGALKRFWPVIVAAMLVAVATMWAITPVAIDTTRKVGSYQAIAVLLVQPGVQTISNPSPTPAPTPTGHRTPTPSPTPTAEPTQTANTAQGVSRVALLVEAGEIPHRAAHALGEAEDPAALVHQLAVGGDTKTGTVLISMHGKDGQRITEVVNAFAQEAVRYFETPRPEVVVGQVTLLDEATPLPFEPANEFVVPPDRGQRLIIAAFLGLLAGAALAVILGLLDTRIGTVREVRKFVGLPVLAAVPRSTRSGRNPRENPEADAYRIAESTLASLPRSTGTDLNLILMTSALPSERTTDSAIKLAEAFAETGSTVLIIEANLRVPELAAALDARSSAGIADWVANPTVSSLEAIAHPTVIPGVRLISAGSSIPDPAAIASRLGPLLAQARGLADYVIVVAPPLLAATEVYDLIPGADAVVLVVDYNKLTRPVGERVGELLQRFEGPALGALLVGVPGGARGRRPRRRAEAMKI